MNPRWSWYYVILGLLFFIAPICAIIWNLVMTPSLWGVKQPLIYQMLWAFGSGIGFTFVGQAVVSGIMNTVSRQKKRIVKHFEKKRVLKLVKQLKEMRNEREKAG